MIRKVLVWVVPFLMCASSWAEPINQYAAVTLSHVKGCQSVGIRGGHGTKNKFDVGLTYAYCFNEWMSFLVEMDREWASIGNCDFTNLILVSPGIEHNLKNPVPWFYWHWGIGPAVGVDRWDNRIISRREQGAVFGAQVGTGVEFIPWTKFTFVIKAQQYVLFGKDHNYFKPNFSLALRFNFHR